MNRGRPVDLPAESRLAPGYAGAHLADAFAVRLPDGASGDVVQLARTVMAARPGFVGPLMAARDLVMGRLGVKTSAEIARAGDARPLGRIGAFGVEAVHPFEVVMAQDDRHLDFKTSFLLLEDGAGRQLVWVSVVRCNNALGRLYLGAIAPFHRVIVPAFLSKAVRSGWPQRPVSR